MMNKLIVCAAMAGLVGVVSGASALAPYSILYGPITNPTNNHQYDVIASALHGYGLNWTTARTEWPAAWWQPDDD